MKASEIVRRGKVLATQDSGDLLRDITEVVRYRGKLYIVEHEEEGITSEVYEDTYTSEVWGGSREALAEYRPGLDWED